MARENGLTTVAADVIKEAGEPLHVNEISDRIIATGRTTLGKKGKTPRATVAARLVTLANKGETFVKTAPGTFGLLELEHKPMRKARAKAAAKPAEASPAEDLAAKASEIAKDKGVDDPRPEPAKRTRKSSRKRAAAAA